MPRKRHLDYALKSSQRGIWIVTGLILIAGAVAIYLATTTGERGRLRLLNRIEVGDSVQRVTRVLGEPARTCTTGSLEHLRTQFPPGWSPAAIDRALQQLQEQTAQRLLFPLDERREVSCARPRRTTEIGLNLERRVIWYVPIAEREPLELPPGFTPETVVRDEDTDG